MTAAVLAGPGPKPTPGNPFPAPWPGAPCATPRLVTCPTCGDPVAGLLGGCWKPACLTADLDYDALFNRRDDI